MPHSVSFSTITWHVHKHKQHVLLPHLSAWKTQSSPSLYPVSYTTPYDMRQMLSWPLEIRSTLPQVFGWRLNIFWTECSISPSDTEQDFAMLWASPCLVYHLRPLGVLWMLHSAFTLSLKSNFTQLKHRLITHPNIKPSLKASQTNNWLSQPMLKLYIIKS